MPLLTPIVETVSPLQRPKDQAPMELWVQDAAAYKMPSHLDGFSLLIKERDLNAFGRDESGGRPVRVAAVLAPATEGQLSAILRRFSAGGKPLTVGSAHTGLSRGAVPPADGQESLSLRAFEKEITLGKDASGKDFAVVSPSLTLREVQEFVEAKGLYYPPDPTERSALIGGSIATNASGPRTFKYGPTRDWVRALRVMLANGEVLALRRGTIFAGPEGRFVIRMQDGSQRIVPIPTYAMPAVKNAAGYYAKPGMDLIDLFIGSEGTLGVITQAELALIRKPAHRYTGNVYFANEASARGFAAALRHGGATGVSASLLEYFDEHSVGIIRGKFGRIDPRAKAAIYFEQEITALSGGSLEDEPLVATWRKLMLEYAALDIQEAFTDAQREHLREQRHSIPEEVNRRLTAAGVGKVASDIAVPDEKFEEMMACYRETLRRAGLPYVIWGHIGNCHVHVNMIPGNAVQEKLAREKLLDFARKAKELGGTITAEHGTGKIKIPQLELLYGPEALREMAAVKDALDPVRILSPGNIERL